MQTTATTLIANQPVFSSGNTFGKNNHLENEMANILIDSYNTQIHHANLLKQKTGYLMNSLAYRSHKKERSLEEILNVFLDSSHRLLEECTSEIFDLYIESEESKFHRKTGNDGVSFFDATNSGHNSDWMEDWIKQIEFLNDREDIYLLDEEDDFCEYVDVTGVYLHQ